MTSRDKAKELISKFRKFARPQSSGFLVSNEDVTLKSAKENALICIEEIIQELNDVDLKTNVYIGYCKSHEYWLEVKKEIELL